MTGLSPTPSAAPSSTCEAGRGVGRFYGAVEGDVPQLKGPLPQLEQLLLQGP